MSRSSFDERTRDQPRLVYGTDLKDIRNLAVPEAVPKLCRRIFILLEIW